MSLNPPPFGEILLPADDSMHSARQLPPHLRFEQLKEDITSAFSLPLTFSNPDFAALSGDQYFGVRKQHLGETFAADMQSTAYSATMTRGSTRSANVSLIFVLNGRMQLSQNNNTNTMHAGEVYLFNAARPAEFHFLTPFREVILGIPRKMLMQYLPHIDRYTALPIRMTPNLQLLCSLACAAANTASARQSGGDALAQVSDTFGSLAGNALASAFEQEKTGPIHREALLLLIQDFMRRHLGDSELTPARIAAANHLSERPLYELFRANGLSVMDWLWSLRLTKVREMLSESTFAHLTLAEVAFACGFKRLFRHICGLTPLPTGGLGAVSEPSSRRA